MKVLVIGHGGREHALVKSFSRSPSVVEVHCIPGNDGIAKEALCHKISLEDKEQIIQFCLRTEIDYVFIGPEDPLVQGLADHLRERGILVVGPNADGAKLEGSKIFAKEFMMSAQVPTAKYEIVRNLEQTLHAAKSFTPPYVLKADGLAAGKGVYICKDLPELESAATDLFIKKILGKSGEQALLEQFMPGWELSFLILTNGNEHVTLPLAQDHKRLNDNHTGPNTGGMGTIAPLNIASELLTQIEEKIVKPSIKEIKTRGMIFRGILFIGVMITEQGPQVLEYNVRFGDPETQVILPLIENDTALLFKNLARGILDPIKIRNIHTCCVIMASEGYPQNPKKNVLIEGDLLSETPSSYFIHAGTIKSGSDQWLTNGGRVLGAVGLGSTLQEAIANAYNQASKAHWPAKQMRSDIGKYAQS